jgi:LEA14-like dessication related protein
MKKYLAPIFLASLITALLAGCTNSTLFSGLQVDLTGIVRAADGSVQANWRLQNPNLVPYLVDSVTAKVYLKGVLVGGTVNREPRALPNNAVADGSSPILLTGTAADKLIREAAAAGTVDYRMETLLVLRLYGDTLENATLVSTGTVPVVQK